MNEEKPVENAAEQAKRAREEADKHHPFNARDDAGELTAQAKHDRDHKCYECRRGFRKGEQNLVCMRPGVGVFRLCRPCGKQDGESRLLGAGVYVGAGGVENLDPFARDRVARKMKKLKREARASAKRERARIARMPKKAPRPDGPVQKDTEV